MAAAKWIVTLGVELRIWQETSERQKETSRIVRILSTKLIMFGYGCWPMAPEFKRNPNASELCSSYELLMRHVVVWIGTNALTTPDSLIVIILIVKNIETAPALFRKDSHLRKFIILYLFFSVNKSNDRGYRINAANFPYFHNKFPMGLHRLRNWLLFISPPSVDFFANCTLLWRIKFALSSSCPGITVVIPKMPRVCSVHSTVHNNGLILIYQY